MTAIQRFRIQPAQLIEDAQFGELMRYTDSLPPPRRIIRGHYYEPSPKLTPAQIFARLDAQPHSFAGVYYRRSWGDLERNGELVLDEVHAVRLGCVQRGMGLVVMVEHKHFGVLTATSTHQPAPAGVELVTHKVSQPAQMADIFNPNGLARLCWFVQRLAEFDGLPGFDGLDTSETAPGPDLTDAQKAALEPAICHYYRSLRAFKVTQVFAGVNSFFSDAREVDMCDFAHECGLGLSAPDMLVTTANTNRPAGMPLLAHMSLRTFEKLGTIPAAFEIATREGGKVDALTWTDWMKAPNDWASVLKFTAANPL